MSEPQILKTQHSQQSLPPHQQTYHVIPATVIQTHPQGNQSNVTNLTQKNLSIINRSENQIPSMHYQSKNHKQNQSQSSMNKIQQEKISQNQSKLTQHQNNQNKDDLQSEKDEKIKGLKPTQNHQKANDKAKNQEQDKKLLQKKQQKQTKDKQDHQIKVTEKQQQKHKEKKEQAHKQVKKEDVNKEKKKEVYKEKKEDIKKQKKEEEVHKNKKEEPVHKQIKKEDSNKDIKEEPHKQTKKEEPHKDKKDDADNDKKQVHKQQVLQTKKDFVHQTQNEIPSQHKDQQFNPINQQKSNKKVEKTPQVNQSEKKLEKKQSKVQDHSNQNTKQPLKQDKIQKQQNKKIVEPVKQSKKAHQVSTKNQQSNQKKKQQKAEQNKVEKQEKNIIQEHEKKPQLKQKVLKEANKEKNQKSSNIQNKQDAPIVHKAVPQDNKTNLSNISLNWNKLAQSFIEKVSKIKHQNVKTKEAQHKKIDLNLQLGSSQISSQKDDENRIKLEFKLYDNKKIEENQVFAEGQNQDDKKNVNQTQKQINKQKLPIKLSFSLYDLKNTNQKESEKTTHKINEQRLKGKLQEITKKFDKNQFLMKINENIKSPVHQQPSGKKQSEKKIQKARIDFRFSTDFISNELKIKKERINELKDILTKNLQKVIKQDKNIEGNLQKNNVNYTTFCQLLTTYPLKTIQPMKFLQLLLGGFKLRIFRENINKASQTQNIDIEQTLYEVLLSLFPQQVYQYIEKVSGGVGKIKFRSIQNLTKLLTRLGINEMLGETPTVKELLHELIDNLKTLFHVYEQKKQQEVQKVSNDQIKNLSQLWKVFQSVFQECKSNVIEIQLKLFSTLGIRLILQCKSQTIKHLYQQVTATTTN